MTNDEQIALDALPAMRADIEAGRVLFGDSHVVPEQGAEAWYWLMDHVDVIYKLIKARHVGRTRILITYERHPDRTEEPDHDRTNQR